MSCSFAWLLPGRIYCDSVVSFCCKRALFFFCCGCIVNKRKTRPPHVGDKANSTPLGAGACDEMSFPLATGTASCFRTHTNKVPPIRARPTNPPTATPEIEAAVHIDSGSSLERL